MSRRTRRLWGTWDGSEFVLVPTSARVPACERALKALEDRRRQAQRQLDDVEREIEELEGLGPNREAELTSQRDETRRHIDRVNQEIADIEKQFELAA